VQHLSGITPTAVLATMTGLKPNTTYHYRVVASAMDGLSNGTDRTVTATGVPTLGELKISPSSFRAAGKGKGKGKAGATVNYTDTQASSTTFTVRRCVKFTKHGHRKCTRYVKVGSFKHADRSGRNSFHFGPRLGRRPLAPGAYRLDAAPRANHLTGKTASAMFSIVR
jgi:hypothetical protein